MCYSDQKSSVQRTLAVNMAQKIRGGESSMFMSRGVPVLNDIHIFCVVF